MLIRFYTKWLLWALAFFTPISAMADEELLPPVDLLEVQSFSAEKGNGKLDKRPLLLAFVADYCHYCEVIEEEFLKPMLRNRDYDEKVVIRTLELSDYANIQDFDGKYLPIEDLAERYQVKVTPTVVFLGRDGTELAPKIVGVANVEFYGGFLDDAIDASLIQLKQ